MFIANIIFGTRFGISEVRLKFTKNEDKGIVNNGLDISNKLFKTPIRVNFFLDFPEIHRVNDEFIIDSFRNMV